MRHDRSNRFLAVLIWSGIAEADQFSRVPLSPGAYTVDEKGDGFCSLGPGGNSLVIESADALSVITIDGAKVHVDRFAEGVLLDGGFDGAALVASGGGQKLTIAPENGAVSVRLGSKPPQKWVHAKSAAARGVATGIGGIFFKAKDAKKLRGWYEQHLGMVVSSYGFIDIRWRELADRSRVAHGLGDVQTRKQAFRRAFHYQLPRGPARCFVEEVKRTASRSSAKEDEPGQGRFAWIATARATSSSSGSRRRAAEIATQKLSGTRSPEPGRVVLDLRARAITARNVLHTIVARELVAVGGPRGRRESLSETPLLVCAVLPFLAAFKPFTETNNVCPSCAVASPHLVVLKSGDRIPCEVVAQNDDFYVLRWHSKYRPADRFEVSRRSTGRDTIPTRSLVPQTAIGMASCIRASIIDQTERYFVIEGDGFRHTLWIPQIRDVHKAGRMVRLKRRRGIMRPDGARVARKSSSNGPCTIISCRAERRAHHRSAIRSRKMRAAFTCLVALFFIAVTCVLSLIDGAVRMAADPDAVVSVVNGAGVRPALIARRRGARVREPGPERGGGRGAWPHLARAHPRRHRWRPRRNMVRGYLAAVPPGARARVAAAQGSSVLDLRPFKSALLNAIGELGGRAEKASSSSPVRLSARPTSRRGVPWKPRSGMPWPRWRTLTTRLTSPSFCPTTA